MKITELFEIHKPKTLTFNSMTKDPNGINFVSSRATQNGCNGKVARVDGLTIYPAGAISVPLKGSVLEASLQLEDFYCAHQTAVLIPKVELTVRQKIYYILVIRSYKFKYNYGRQADRTIDTFELPSLEEIPDWVETMDIPSFEDVADSKISEKVELPDISLWKDFTYSELFEIKKVTGPRISDAKKTTGNVPYVSATAENNGIALYGDFEPTVKGNCITVGHLGDCFYQDKDFAGTNVTAMIPKFELNKKRAMFLLPLLNASKSKYCYGRVIGVARLNKEIISLPVKDGNPDWDLMEKYIISLPYSKYL